MTHDLAEPVGFPSNGIPHATSSASAAAPTRAYPTIIYCQTKPVKASIDENVPCLEVIAQLCASLPALTEPPAMYCLRDLDSDALVTDDNLVPHLQNGSKMKLVSSPVIEAAEMVEKLSTGNPSNVKLGVFALKRYIQEPVFMEEFISRGGQQALMACIDTAHGNTLSYALTSLHKLLDSTRGWDSIDQSFASKIVRIFATQSLVNVARPAASILRQIAHGPEKDPSPSTSTTGFDRLWPLIQAEPDFFKMMVVHLRAADHLLISEVMQLLVALMRAALSRSCAPFYEQTEANSVRQCVYEINESKIRESAVIPAIVGFQECLIGFSHMQFSLSISMESEGHQPLLAHAWAGLGLSENDPERLSRLGLLPPVAFPRTGLFGLKTLVEVFQSPEDPITLPTAGGDHECPIGSASDAVLSSLCSIWGIDKGESTSSIPQSLLLNYPAVHKMSLKLFLRLWSESRAIVADFDRVASLVDSFLRSTLRGDGQSGMRQLELLFASATYKSIRNKQMDEAALEDELLNKASIRNLRGRLYNECFELVRAQRIDCLLKGSWFMHTASDQTHSSRESKRSTIQGIRWRFYRLATNRRMLHYCETTERGNVRPGLLDLPHSIDVLALKDILPTGTPRRTPLTPHSSQTNSSVSVPPPNLSFGLYGERGLVAQLTAPDAHTYSEWIDGLSLVRPNGYIHTKETADLIQSLTDVNVQVKLLDLTGERVVIPSEAGEFLEGLEPPTTCRFYYAQM